MSAGLAPSALPLRPLGLRLAVAAVVLVALAAGAAVARADGEAGLVIQNGDQVTGICVPFTGDSIRGDQLLAAAGIAVEQFGGGSRAVCALDAVGCFDASTFNGCFCKCAGGGACTYWAFFTKVYGAGWVYSALASNQARARDGDLQGWKWGEGTLQNAPVPRDVTFEDVCGHAPRGGAAAVTPLPPTPATTAPPAPTTAAPPVATTAPPAATATPSTAGATPTATGSATATPPEAQSPSPAATGSATPSAPPATVTAGDVTIAHPSLTVLPPQAGPGGDSGDGGGGAGAGALVGFGAVVAVLGAGIAAALFWRRAHGA